jgi:pimeloyl-ACP methyl ester carboxylesterase
VLHGRSDEVIPFEQGQRLAAAVPGAEFVALPCGHNDCPRQWDRVLAFLGGGPAD